MGLAEKLIDQETGEIDQLMVYIVATNTCIKEWPGYDYPPNYFRSHKRYYDDVARAMRTCWRRDHNLPRDDYDEQS